MDQMQQERTNKKMAAHGDFCCLHVRVQCRTRHGQTLAVTGSGRAFQSSGLSFIPLVTTPESYPIWYTPHPIVVPREESFTYKYCILEGGSVKAEEQRLTPRSIIPGDANQVVEDSVDLSQIGNSRVNGEDLQFESDAPSRPSEGDLEWINMGERNCRLFLVCYHLPVEIRRTGLSSDPFEVTWSDSLIAKTDGLIANNLETFWIGTVPLSSQELSNEDKSSLIEVLSKMKCIPIFLDLELTSNAYYGFCKTVMWPVFHNVDQLDQVWKSSFIVYDLINQFFF